MPTPHEPQTLTVEEAARILRIGRTAAYALAREWRTTGGRSGLPVLELGRTLRVPRAALTRLLSLGSESGGAGSVHADSLLTERPERLAAAGEQGSLWDDREAARRQRQASEVAVVRT